MSIFKQRRNLLFIVRLLNLLFAIPCFSQTQESNLSASNTYSKLENLSTLASVLYVGTVPSDKNVELLDYFSRQRYYRTGFLSITRGERQENLYGIDEGIALGLLHVQESIESAKIDKVESFYTRACDLGANINDSDVLSKWDKNKVLGDIVWIIRKFQPDVIISKYSPQNKTNGQGMAGAELCIEAFNIAGDSTYFPEQFQYGVRPWSAKKLFCDDSTLDGSKFKVLPISINAYNSVIGYNTADVSLLSKAFQQTQYRLGDTSGEHKTLNNLYLIEGDTTSGFMNGIDTTWNKIYGANNTFSNLINSLLANYDFRKPYHSLPDLQNAYQYILKKKKGTLWEDVKLKEIQDIMLSCLGITCNISSIEKYAVVGDSLHINVSVTKRAPNIIEITRIRIGPIDSLVHLSLEANKNYTFAIVLPVDKNKPAWQPYWLKTKADNTFSYALDDQLDVGRSEAPPEYITQVAFKVDSCEFTQNYPVKSHLSGKFVESFVKTVLPVIVDVRPGVIITNVKPGNEYTKNPTVQVTFKSNIMADSIKIHLALHQLGLNVKQNEESIGTIGSKELYVQDSIMSLQSGNVYSTSVPLQMLPIKYDSSINPMIGASITTFKDGDIRKYSSFLSTINYNYLPEVSYWYTKNVKIVPDEIKILANTVGYIYPSNDVIYSSLLQLGCNVKILSNKDFLVDTLTKLSCIVIGGNLASVQDYLGKDNYDSLLSYISRGGNLIFFDEKKAINISNPFSLTSVINRIPATDATVEIASNHPIFFTPNKFEPSSLISGTGNLTGVSFIYQDTTFEKPLSITCGKKAFRSENNFLIKKYGGGNFFFIGISLNQPLSNGMAWAYKLLANLVSFPSIKCIK
jgi:hypothetical protein